MWKLSSVGSQKGRSGYELLFSKASWYLFRIIQTTVLFACAVLVYLYNYVLICMYIISVRHIVSTFVCMFIKLLCLLCRTVFVDFFVVTMSYSVVVLQYLFQCIHSMNLVFSFPPLHSYFFPNRAKHTNIKTEKKII